MAIGGSDSRDHAGEAAPAAHAALVADLLKTQNQDGGWPYGRGTSWTEPTALALLALGPGHAACARGYAWLRAQQRSDGGWAPKAGVDAATWVTSLVALLPPQTLGPQYIQQARGWILAGTGANSTFWYRLRERMLGSNSSEEHPGWPWFPGTAAWVAPTSLAMLALRKSDAKQPAIGERLRQGREFLLARRCADGGWNHGSARALGYEGNSYPETTGVALLALAGVPNLERSIAAAERHWRQCRSAEGAAWLKLGLLAHGVHPAGRPAQAPPRNVRDTALSAIAGQAEKGANVFLA